jgi:pyruvate,water dikinase
MVQPELAGVAFTINPATGAEEIVIEACEGLSEALLAGHTPPLAQDHPLVCKYRAEIESMARAIQRHFGAPQDIEFAVADGQLYVLQARPITRVNFPPEIGEWTNADFRDGGVSCGVCTPLMWSLYDLIWEHTLKGFLRDIKLLDSDFQAGKMFFGRPYWNLGAVKRCLAKLPGFVERDFDRDLGVELNYEGDGVCTPITLQGLMRAVPTLMAIQSIWKRQARFDQSFLEDGFNTLVRGFELASPSLERFRDLIYRAYWLTESNYFRTIYCASLAKLDFTESFPAVDYPRLVSALPPMKHLAPTEMLRAMAQRKDNNIDPLLTRFPHRSRRELDIRAPRWDEDPEWVAQLLKDYPGTAGNDPGPAYRQERAHVMARLPWHKRRRFERKLDRLRHFLWLREEMRDLSSRMYHLIRRYVLALAEQKGLGDDVFFMTFQEILANDSSRVAEARYVFESYRNYKAPNEIGARTRLDVIPKPRGLQGIAASAGMARGTARIARNIEDALQVEKGAILVCPFTDPGWTPVLDRVTGVVTETGGLLSHAAVICREYGIPAVLGVPEATSRIPDGASIHLHGSHGRVELLEGASSPYEAAGAAGSG